VRLLVVNPSPVRGGAEQMLLDLCTRTTRLDVTVACLADGPFVDDLSAAGVRVERIPAGRLRNPWAWARTVRRLVRLAHTHDLVVGWQVKGHYYGTPAARLARAPVAWWDHGVRPARGEPRYLVDNLLPRSLRADLVVGSSRAIAARHAPARTIYPGISLEPYTHASRTDARAGLGLEPDEQAVGIVGRLQPWKGQHVLLRAAPAVLEGHPRAHIIVIGSELGGFSAGYRDELEKLAADLGVTARVSFLGQRDDVPALLPGLDVFVNASFGEPFGIVTVEAMAAGVPVVVTAAGGAPEIVDDGATGMLVVPGDARSLAEAIDALLTEPDRSGALVAAGLRTVRERFEVGRFVREVEELADELTRARAKAR